MDFEQRFLAKHNLDTSSPKALAEDLSKRFAANVRYQQLVKLDGFEDFKNSNMIDGFFDFYKLENLIDEHLEIEEIYIESPDPQFEIFVEIEDIFSSALFMCYDFENFPFQMIKDKEEVDQIRSVIDKRYDLVYSLFLEFPESELEEQTLILGKDFIMGNPNLDGDWIEFSLLFDISLEASAEGTPEDFFNDILLDRIILRDFVRDIGGHDVIYFSEEISLLTPFNLAAGVDMGLYEKIEDLKKIFYQEFDETYIQLSFPDFIQDKERTFLTDDAEITLATDDFSDIKEEYTQDMNKRKAIYDEVLARTLED